MPVLSLSAVVTVSSNADGSRLKCMIGSKVAAKAESITKLCSSGVLGLRLWCDFRNAKQDQCRWQDPQPHAQCAQAIGAQVQALHALRRWQLLLHRGCAFRHCLI